MQHRVAQKQSEQDVLLGRRANSTNVIPAEAVSSDVQSVPLLVWLDPGLLDSSQARNDEIHSIF